MAQIHQFSVVDPNAQLADDVVVGPFCVIGPNVKIGAGTVLKSHVTSMAIRRSVNAISSIRMLASVAIRKTRSTQANLRSW